MTKIFREIREWTIFFREIRESRKFPEIFPGNPGMGTPYPPPRVMTADLMLLPPFLISCCSFVISVSHRLIEANFIPKRWLGCYGMK